MEQDQVNRQVVPVWRCSAWPGTAGCSGHCEQVHEAALICLALLVHYVKYMMQDILVDLLIDCWLCRKNLLGIIPLTSKNVNMTLTFDFVLLFMALAMSETSTDCSGAWFLDHTQNCPVGWGCRIYQLHFCRGVRPPPHPKAISWP